MTNTEQPEKVSVSLDAKDYEILRLLEENAKLTVREIAGLIHLSPTPTHERIKRMEKSGVIKQYAAILNRQLVGKGMIVLCMITLREHNKRSGAVFIKAMLEFKEIVECYNISGDFDFMVKIVAKSMEDYHNFFVNKLGEVKGIGQTKSIFVMAAVKETHQLI
ncbi:DNA-binding Lrp family transcriptional regulator [Pedobacter cryoconitis]|uniref:DNA-binding Lrp family transcriptional regulator n=1 Tax=Pedobacter cryoconitis TaxID=188932 RepID=A0A7W9DK01_9SPHI|nr:Lrp/AsnC family transcriptional regulator [Pedobacter cryoconitis]MBB5621741.1 DNA-binding Lrp family transcriptional regulator [Pedobacter cryoconitis]